MSSSSSITRLERRCPDVRTGPFNGVSGYLQGDFSRRLMVVGANELRQGCLPRCSNRNKPSQPWCRRHAAASGLGNTAGEGQTLKVGHRTLGSRQRCLISDFLRRLGNQSGL